MSSRSYSPQTVPSPVCFPGPKTIPTSISSGSHSLLMYSLLIMGTLIYPFGRIPLTSCSDRWSFCWTALLSPPLANQTHPPRILHIYGSNPLLFCVFSAYWQWRCRLGPPGALTWAHSTCGSLHRHFPTRARVTPGPALVVLHRSARHTSATISSRLWKNKFYYFQDL